MLYSYTKKSPYSCLETIDELRIAFAEKWFWVVSNINIAEKIKAKVDKNFEEYTTLWFCNPVLAHKYLSTDINLWIFMPCSVSVYKKNNEVFISAWLPEVVISKVIENDNLENLHKEISDIMKIVIDSI